MRPSLGIWYLDCPSSAELLQSCRFIENEANACIGPRRLLGEVSLLLSVKAGIKSCIIGEIARTITAGVFYDEIENPSRKSAGGMKKLGSFVQTMAVEPFLRAATRHHSRHDGSTAMSDCKSESTHVQETRGHIQESVAAARKFCHVSLLRMRRNRAIRIRILVAKNDNKANTIISKCRADDASKVHDVENLYEALYLVAVEFREHCDSIETSYTIVCTDSSIMNQARTRLRSEMNKRSSTYVHWHWIHSLVESLTWELASDQERHLAIKVASGKRC